MYSFARRATFVFRSSIGGARNRGCKRWPILQRLRLKGRQRRSPTTLLQLPPEILSKIIDMLETYEDGRNTLANLALVNRRCRDLAQERQFKHLHLRYSPASCKLLQHMDANALDDKDKTSLSSSIGLYVRTVAFRVRSDDVEKEISLMRYIEHFFSVIVSEMPNLDVLVWDHWAKLGTDFIETISRCAAKHVKLTRIVVGKSWLERPSLAPTQWDLRSLDLDIAPRASSRLEVGATLLHPTAMVLDEHTSAFLNTLFQRCSSTLESLTWSHAIWTGHTFKAPLDSSNLAFPKLRCLRLRYANFAPSSFLLFLGPSLRHLEIPRTSLDMIPGSLKSCGLLQHLQTLVLNVNEDDIPDHSLAAISSIASLEQLTLFVSCLSTRACNWLVDHDKLRCRLKGLFRLKTLTLISDTYSRPGLENIIPENYYTENTVLDADFEDAKARPYSVADTDYMFEPFEIIENSREAASIDIKSQIRVQYVLWGFRRQCDDIEKRIWERAHRNRMLAQAEAHAEVFPALEWIYCGHWEMGFRPRLGEDGIFRKEAFPLVEKRDDWPAFLSKTFG